MKTFFLIFLLFFSSSAFSAYYTDNLAPVSAYGTPRQQLPYFNEIEINSGDRIFDVRIIANTPYHDIQILNPTINPKILFKTEGPKLQVALQVPKAQIDDEVVAIVIRCPGEVRSLSFYGEGQVIGVRMDSSFLDLEVMGDGVVQLRGNSINLHRARLTDTSHTKVTGLKANALHVEMYKNAEAALMGEANVKDIQQYDSSRLVLFWSNSTDLSIHLSEASGTFLAGVTDVLDATVDGRSRLDARYLRARRGFIVTNNNAHVDVAISNDLNTQSRGDSDIYFFQEPNQNNPRMIENGAVLDMTNLSLLRKHFNCGDCFSRLFQE